MSRCSERSPIWSTWIEPLWPTLPVLIRTVANHHRLAVVEGRHVDGWDDPRMPTLAGLRRRGFTPAAIRNFCERIGVSTRDSLVDVSLLGAFEVSEQGDLANWTTEDPDFPPGVGGAMDLAAGARRIGAFALHLDGDGLGAAMGEGLLHLAGIHRLAQLELSAREGERLFHFGFITGRHLDSYLHPRLIRGAIRLHTLKPLAFTQQSPGHSARGHIRMNHAIHPQRRRQFGAVEQGDHG